MGHISWTLKGSSVSRLEAPFKSGKECKLGLSQSQTMETQANRSSLGMSGLSGIVGTMIKNGERELLLHWDHLV